MIFNPTAWFAPAMLVLKNKAKTPITVSPPQQPCFTFSATENDGIMCGEIFVGGIL
jgi:hypothetical protein